MGKGYKGKNPRGVKKEADAEAEADWQAKQRGGQSSKVGMLPPSDSEEESEDDGAQPKPKQDVKPQQAKPAGQPATAGLLPPSDSEDDDDSSSEDEPEYLRQAAVKKPKEVPVERSAEDIRKEMERLEIIKKKREDDRKKRIATEGWDRFAPVTATNHPPGRDAASS